MNIPELTIYCTALSLLITLGAALLTFDPLRRRLALGLITGVLLTSAFLVGLASLRIAPRAATPAPGMVPLRARAPLPSLTPSEKKSHPKIFKNKIDPKTFSAPFGTKLMRAADDQGHMLTSEDLFQLYAGAAAGCRRADHALECACSKADDCSNAPR